LYIKILARSSVLGGTLEGRFIVYRGGAKQRDVFWGLSFQEFSQFWQQPCFYCGDSIASIGLDRIDNNVGYIISNVVSCCTEFNRMKNNKSFLYFIDKCKRIANNLE